MWHFKSAFVWVCSFIILNNFYTKETTGTIQKRNVNNPSKLAVLWTSGDREVALKMVFMYVSASKKIIEYY